MTGGGEGGGEGGEGGEGGGGGREAGGDEEDPTVSNFRHSKYSAWVRNAPTYDRFDNVCYVMS